MRLSALAAYARTLGCTAEEQVSMIDYTSFKIGGPADVYITAPTEAAAAAALIFPFTCWATAPICWWGTKAFAAR